MNIGIDARPLSYRLTGIGIFLKNLLDALQQIDRANDYYLLSNGPIHYDVKNPRWSKIEGRSTNKFTGVIWLQSVAPLLAIRKKLDIFWGPRHNIPLFLPVYTKTVLTIHDVMHRVFPETMTLQNFVTERVMATRSIKKANRIVTDSLSTASDIRNYYRIDSNKLVVIHPGIPSFPEESTTTLQSDGFLPGRRYFLVVGTLDPRKNFSRIMNAFERINPEKHDISLVFVGTEGWKNSFFRNAVASHPLRNRICMAGYVGREQLKEIYQHAICLLFPSLYEGFGFPILEAMSCGTPVISSDLSSMPEVAGDAAILINPYRVEEIAAAMLRILEDPKLRGRMKRMGLERVKAFSWERSAVQMMSEFRTLGGNKVLSK